jgi:uracil-DNA glycosylase family 4
VNPWARLNAEIEACGLCPRLRAHCRQVAKLRRRAFRDQVYWGRPVVGFGDRSARVLLCGLAPAAHGANRTGRMFTGDDSGDFLYEALHRAGFASQPTSIGEEDGLTLRDVFITASARCAPPDNRPTPVELRACAPYLAREIELLDRIRIVVALGQIAWNTVLRQAVEVPAPRPKFGHGAEATIRLREDRPTVKLLGCYHPSRQNTNTGRLTRTMLDEVLGRL